MTVVAEKAGLGVGGEAAPPCFGEQADRQAVSNSTPIPPAPAMIRRPTHSNYSLHGQASQLIMVRSGPANTGRTAADRQRSSISETIASVTMSGSSSR